MPQKTDLKPVILRTGDVEVEKLLQDEDELARHSPEQIEQLARDIDANGLLQPIAVTEDMEVIIGQARVAATKKLGMKTIRASIYTKGLTKLQFRLIRAAENLLRNELSPGRKLALYTGLMRDNDWDQQTLAEHLHQTPSAVCKVLSLAKCSDAWLQKLDEGKVAAADCYAASRLTLDLQAELLVKKLSSKLNREGLTKAANKLAAQKDEVEDASPEPKSPPERTMRVRIPLAISSKEASAHGTVTVSSSPGEEIDFEGVETLLKEALKAVRDAQGRRLGLKAAQAAWRDMAAPKSEPDEG